MQGVQGSNPTDDWNVLRRSTAFVTVKFNLTSERTQEEVHVHIQFCLKFSL